MVAEEILREIAEMHPRTYSREGLDDGCFFCGVWEHSSCSVCESEKHFSYVQLHNDDCAWARARKFFGLDVLVCERGHANELVTDHPPTPLKLREPNRETDPIGYMMWKMEGQLIEHYSRPLFFDQLPQHDGTVTYKIVKSDGES